MHHTTLSGAYNWSKVDIWSPPFCSRVLFMSNEKEEIEMLRMQTIPIEFAKHLFISCQCFFCSGVRFVMKYKRKNMHPILLWINRTISRTLGKCNRTNTILYLFLRRGTKHCKMHNAIGFRTWSLVKQLVCNFKWIAFIELLFDGRVFDCELDAISELVLTSFSPSKLQQIIT